MKTVPPPLVVPKPCHAEWASMSGDERKRFCAECGKHVYNLSAMTERESQKFAGETQGRECVAYVRTGEGNMHAPNFMERLILRVAGKRPSFARALSFLLPAALAACVSKHETRVTAGVPIPPSVKSPPGERGHSEELLLGEPVALPKPGKVLMPPREHKPAE